MSGPSITLPDDLLAEINDAAPSCDAVRVEGRRTRVRGRWVETETPCGQKATHVTGAL